MDLNETNHQDPNLRDWLFESIERGFSYKLKKFLYQRFVESVYNGESQCCIQFKLILIVMKHFMIAIAKTIISYNDTLKDLIISTTLWHISNNILVSNM